jgi:hypothetical protein
MALELLRVRIRFAVARDGEMISRQVYGTAPHHEADAMKVALPDENLVQGIAAGLSLP